MYSTCVHLCACACVCVCVFSQTVWLGSWKSVTTRRALQESTFVRWTMLLELNTAGSTWKRTNVRHRSQRMFLYECTHVMHTCDHERPRFHPLKSSLFVAVPQSPQCSSSHTQGFNQYSETPWLCCLMTAGGSSRWQKKKLLMNYFIHRRQNLFGHLILIPDSLQLK